MNKFLVQVHLPQTLESVKLYSEVSNDCKNKTLDENTLNKPSTSTQ